MRFRAVLPLILGCVIAAVPAGATGQIDPRSALLERDGFAALAAGNIPAATDTFREAIAHDPTNPRLQLGAALAASRDRRDGDAKTFCERALELDNAFQPARALLGQTLYRLRDLAGAIRTYEALVTALPDDRDGHDATETLARWRREFALHDRMQQAVGNHFTVSFDGPEEAALAQRASAALDRAYWRIGQELGVYATDPIPVMLYTTEQFRDITRSPAWAGGAYDGIIRVPMRGADAAPEELARVLAHEFAHALIRTLASRGVPAWLNEGLASALESDSIAWAEPRVAAAKPVPLRALQSGFGRLSGDQAALAYATSAVAARRLLDEAGGVAVANLLRDLGDGAAFEAAFARRVQRSFADFQMSLSNR